MIAELRYEYEGSLANESTASSDNQSVKEERTESLNQWDEDQDNEDEEDTDDGKTEHDERDEDRPNSSTKVKQISSDECDDLDKNRKANSDDLNDELTQTRRSSIDSIYHAPANEIATNLRDPKKNFLDDPDEYYPEREYFSDPDYHDVRPGKNSAKYKQAVSFDSHHPIEVNLSGQSSNNKSHPVNGLLEPPHEPDQEASEQLVSLNQVTASEAQPETLEDQESTLADGDVSSISSDGHVRSLSESEQLEHLNESSKTKSTETEKIQREVAEKEESDLEGASTSSGGDVGNVKLVDRDSTSQQLQTEIETEATTLRPDKQAPTVNEEEVKRKFLMALVEDYCNKFVELIKNEALERVEAILRGQQTHQIDRLDLTGTFETQVNYAEEPINQLKTNAVQQDSCEIKSMERRVYTSSLFYDDKKGSYPTLDEQVEKCQTIAKQLAVAIEDLQTSREEDASPTNESRDIAEQIVTPTRMRCEANATPGSQAQYPVERASKMFKRRRDRMRHFTISSCSSAEIDYQQQNPSRGCNFRLTRSSSEASTRQLDADEPKSELSIEEAPTEFGLRKGAATDTEYEAPGVRLSRCQETNCQGGPISANVDSETKPRAKYKPYLDSTTLKDIERLKEWSPRVDFNEHDSVSPEVCQKLVQDLRGQTGAEQAVSKGSRMFELRRMQSSDWVVADREEAGEGVKIKVETSDSAENGPVSLSKSANDCQMAGMRSSEGNLSQPSFVESTVMAVENDYEERLIELAPAIMSHPRPHLELAKITKTPSFSASSRRIIECDSERSSSRSSSSSTPSNLEEPSGQEEDTSPHEPETQTDQLTSFSPRVADMRELESSRISESHHLDERCHQPDDVFIEHRASITSKARPISHFGKLHEAKLVSCDELFTRPTMQFALEKSGDLMEGENQSASSDGSRAAAWSKKVETEQKEPARVLPSGSNVSQQRHYETRAPPLTATNDQRDAVYESASAGTRRVCTCKCTCGAGAAWPRSPAMSDHLHPPMRRNNSTLSLANQKRESFSGRQLQMESPAQAASVRSQLDDGSRPVPTHLRSPPPLQHPQSVRLEQEHAQLLPHRPAAGMFDDGPKLMARAGASCCSCRRCRVVQAIAPRPPAMSQVGGAADRYHLRTSSMSLQSPEPPARTCKCQATAFDHSSWRQQQLAAINNDSPPSSLGSSQGPAMAGRMAPIAASMSASDEWTQWSQVDNLGRVCSLRVRIRMPAQEAHRIRIERKRLPVEYLEWRHPRNNVAH